MATLITIPTQPVTPRRAWNTLEILSRWRTGLLALVALFLITIVIATQIHRGAMQVVGLDTAPSIIAAQQIKSSLADMDADAVNKLMNPASTQSATLFDKHREEEAQALIGAARNISSKADEQTLLETLEFSLGNYERLIQESGDLQGAGQQKQMADRIYRAGILMNGILLPTADKLDKANDEMLEQQYESRSSRSLYARVIVVLFGFATLAALVMAQIFISGRTQRTLNPALLTATLVTLGLTIFAFSAMAREQADLRAAKQDAFASVRALLRARAIAYAGNSDESRYLLDPIHLEEYKRDFQSKAAMLAALPPRMTFEQFTAGLRGGEKISGFTGLLADELNNITYKGEREAADETAIDFERYVGMDKTILDLEQSGKHQQAIDFDIGEREGQSDWAFEQFDAALGKTLAINVREFELARNKGFSAVAHVEWESGLAGLVILVLIFFGFAPRIREYQ